VPYEFLPEHVPFAVETIDRALSGGHRHLDSGAGILDRRRR
jgi:hypothetical protein